MLLFGHIGITSALAKIGDCACPPADDATELKGFRAKCSGFLRRFRDSSGNIDYRMVIIGSLLPDIIDKPLFLIFRHSVYVDGRGFTHSLLVQVLIIAAGLIFRKSWLLLLGYGSLVHLVLDSIWLMPVTLFWPFLGWFPPEEPEGWFAYLWNNLTHNPEIFIPETIGFIICIWFAFRISRDKGWIAFLKHGIVK